MRKCDIYAAVKGVKFRETTAPRFPATVPVSRINSSLPASGKIQFGRPNVSGLSK